MEAARNYMEAAWDYISELLGSLIKQKTIACECVECKTANKEFEDLELDDLVTIKSFEQEHLVRLRYVHIQKEPTRYFALKEICKDVQTPYDSTMLYNETHILSSINCDFILKFHKTFQDSTHIYVMTECYYGGHLGNYLWEKVPISETSSRFYVGCVVEALEYLHSRNIVHGNLKMQNTALDGQGYLKLIGLGAAKKLKTGEKAFTECGTWLYSAPEVIARNKPGYDVGRDLWALGILACEFLFKYHPMWPAHFWPWGNDNLTIESKIRTGFDAASFPEHAPKKAVDFIKNLCRYNPKERLGYGPGGYDNLRKHCWLENFDWQALRERKLTPPLVPEFLDFMKL